MPLLPHGGALREILSPESCDSRNGGDQCKMQAAKTGRTCQECGATGHAKRHHALAVADSAKGATGDRGPRPKKEAGGRKDAIRTRVPQEAAGPDASIVAVAIKAIAPTSTPTPT